MKTRRYLTICGTVLLLALLGALVWDGTRRREPVYEGRELSSWLERHVPTSDANPPYNSAGWHKANEALKTIGTNGIPTLLRMIEAHEPPPFVRTLLDLAQRQRWVRIHYRYPSQRNEEAEYAFAVLSTNAASAVPELIRIYQRNASPSSQRCAALALGHVGRGAGRRFQSSCGISPTPTPTFDSMPSPRCTKSGAIRR